MVQRLVASVALALCMFGQVVAVKATERPVNIVVLGELAQRRLRPDTGRRIPGEACGGAESQGCRGDHH